MRDRIMRNEWDRDIEWDGGREPPGTSRNRRAPILISTNCSGRRICSAGKEKGVMKNAVWGDNDAGDDRRRLFFQRRTGVGLKGLNGFNERGRMGALPPRGQFRRLSASGRPAIFISRRVGIPSNKNFHCLIICGTSRTGARHR